MVEALLIEQVKNGDNKAFEKLIQSTQQRGLNIAYGIVNNPLDAEEVLQEAYLQVFRNIGTLKAPEAFGSWFGRIVTHLALRRSREKEKVNTMPLDLVEQIEDTACDSPEAVVLKKEQQELLAGALKELPGEYKAAVILRDWEHYSYREISEILDIPLGTVKSRIYAARKSLIRILEGGH